MKKVCLVLLLLFSSAALFAQPWFTTGNAAAAGDYIGTNNNQSLNIRTNNNLRILISNGGIANTDGRIAFGNNLIAGFVAQDRLHLHQTGGTVATRFTNGATGTTATDGFQVGITALGNANILNYMANRSISLGTNNGVGGTAFRMRVYSFADNGFISMGNVNNFPTPQAMLHISMFNPNMANTALRGEVFRTDGDATATNAWRLFTGPGAALSTEKFSAFVPNGTSNAHLQATNGDMYFNTFGSTGVQERMRVTNSTGNQVGVPQPNATRVNISYGAGYAPISAATALLNLGFEAPTNGPVGGQRNWMDVGTFTCASSDNMYVGLKNEDPNGSFGPNNNDRMDAVINWGDNNGTTAPFGPDRLRFIFTSVQNPATPTGASSNNGLETMRMIPVNNTTVFTGIGGDPQINLYSAGVDPGNTLEVNSNGATNVVGGSSGLRFTNLNTTSPVVATNPGAGVLAVDANGDVIYVQANAGPSFGGACGNNNIMNADFEIPMNNFNYVFTGQGTGTNSVGIGTPAGACTPLPAKLTVNDAVTTLNSIAILGRNSGPNSCSIMAINTGVGGTTNNPQVGGWFQTIPDQYAVVVPKGGGFVSIGYAGAVAGPNFSWNGTFTTGVPTAMVDVAGSMYMGGQLVSASDSTLKHNVQTIPNALTRVLNLRGVNFEWNIAEDSTMTGTHCGFIAQEVNGVIPEVVHTNSLGIKSIAYTEVIPYLVEALKEEHARNDSLSTRLDSLISVVSGCCNSSARVAGSTFHQQDIVLANSESIVLNQNTPNPFAEQTTITYYLPETVVKAQLLFYDASGKLIKAVDLDGRGDGQINVFADDLSTGIYSYALVADGQIADTKKMIKSK